MIHYSLSTPTRTQNLTAYFVFFSAEKESTQYQTLEEGLLRKEVSVIETGKVRHLLVRNAGDLPLFIQAGDLVRGGRQDRTMGVDFIVPAHSEQLSVPAFCVESRRWRRRGNESAKCFSSSGNWTTSKKIRSILRTTKSQAKVWKCIGKEQKALSQSIGSEVSNLESPSSLELTYCKIETEAALQDYERSLPSAPPELAVGVVWLINGKPSHADWYGNSELFQKLWKKLLRAAVLEALAEARETDTNELSTDQILTWIESKPQQKKEEECLAPRTRVFTSRAKDALRVETIDRELDSMVHASLLGPRKYFSVKRLMLISEGGGFGVFRVGLC